MDSLKMYLNNTKVINIIHYEKIDSTQKEMWRRIQKGNVKNGTIITADIQTEAIGTHGRKWYTTNKDNIAFTFVIYPNVNITKLENVTIKVAQILVSVFEELYKIKLDIKEPNDLIIKGKKVGGILCETKLQGEIVKCLVIGIGINTNQTTFEKELENIATSIRNEYEIKIDNNKVIMKFYNSFREFVIKSIYKEN